MTASPRDTPREEESIDTSRAGAVLLAAGESRRMGGINKLLVEIDGVPLVRRTLAAIRGAGIGEIVVVLGHQADRVEPLLRASGVRLVRHADYALGQQESILAGLRALSATTDPVMVVLGDLPLLEASDLRALLAAHAGRAPGRRALRPIYQGRRGNPVVVERSVVDQVIAGAPAPAGLRGFLDDHPEIVASFDASSDHYIFDLDTPDDIERLERRTGLAVRARGGEGAEDGKGSAAARTQGDQ